MTIITDSIEFDEYRILLEREKLYLPIVNFMSKSPKLTFGDYRSCLAMMLELIKNRDTFHTNHRKFDPEVIFLAANYLMRLFQVHSISRSMLKLVTYVVFSIAHKYLEGYPLKLKKHPSYKTCEATVLYALNFNISVPTILTFVKHLWYHMSKSVEEFQPYQEESKYIDYISLEFLKLHDMVKYPYSVIAVACLARRLRYKYPELNIKRVEVIFRTLLDISLQSDSVVLECYADSIKLIKEP